MILLNIFDIKDTMAHLLLKESFDVCLLEEACVTTFATMEIQGRRNMEWYDLENEESKLLEHLYWREVKPFIYTYIKGKRTPSFFAISLKLTENEVQSVFEEQELYRMMKAQQTDVLLHFRFEKGKLSVITGISSRIFTMDKSIEFAWDNAVREFFKKLGVGYEE